MVRPVLDAGVLLRIAAQLGIVLHLRGCEQLRRHQMIFQVSLAKLGLGNPDGGRCRVKTARRDHAACKLSVKVGFLRNELFPDGNNCGTSTRCRSVSPSCSPSFKTWRGPG